MIEDVDIVELSKRHDRGTFSCGLEPLDRYLRLQAYQDVKRHVARCLVATQRGSDAILAYYALAATSIALDDLPAETAASCRAIQECRPLW